MLYKKGTNAFRILKARILIPSKKFGFGLPDSVLCSYTLHSAMNTTACNVVISRLTVVIYIVTRSNDGRQVAVDEAGTTTQCAMQVVSCASVANTTYQRRCL